MGPENSEPVESTESTETSELTNYLEKLKIFASLLPSTLDHVSDIAGRYKVLPKMFLSIKLPYVILT